jgi:hypothetical protein
MLKASPVLILLGAIVFAAPASDAAAGADSYYTVRLDDPKAIYVTRGDFGVRADGVADDTEGLQRAIDQAGATVDRRVVFVPEGRYRLTRSLYVWPGVRVIGYGATRPVLVLGAQTPGYQDAENFLVFFAGRRPDAPGAGTSAGTSAGVGGPGSAPAVAAAGGASSAAAASSRAGATSGAVAAPWAIPREWIPPLEARAVGRGGLNISYPLDATPGTFYSAMSNIDIEIQDGNPRAVGVRARYAQHCYLAHMDFRVGSAMAGLHDGGNFAEDVHFHGGQYGIVTRKPSPGWQFTLVDATFDGQAKAAIKTHEAGLTLIHPRFARVPTAIEMDPDYVEELWIKDGRMEDISGPAIVISREHSLRNEINMEDVICRNVPTFARFRESGKTVAGPAAGHAYVVKTFSHGWLYEDIGATRAAAASAAAGAAQAPQARRATRTAGAARAAADAIGTSVALPAGAVRTVFDATPIAAVDPDADAGAHADRPALPELPARDTWVNVHTLNVKGDGQTDDTAAIRAAVAAHRTLYFPIGKYVVSDTITLKPDTALVALQPSVTALVLQDATPAFQGAGGPVPVLDAPAGGTNIVAGLGIYTNGINPRAVALKWRAGAASMVNDVRFLGGHGTAKIDGSREDIYNNTHTADPNLPRRWDGQYPSLWITDGGGGTFADIWTPSTFAEAGIYVSDTSTPGRVYSLSSEHHVRHEMVLHRASNWEIYALQTEEERGEGGFALPLAIDDSSNITIANLHMYRVVSSFQPFPEAIRVSGSANIRFRNIHCYSDSKVSFDNTVIDETHGARVRQREFAALTIAPRAPQTAESPRTRQAAQTRQTPNAADTRPQSPSPRGRAASTNASATSMRAPATHASTAATHATARHTPPPTLAAGATLDTLASGFYNISGAAAAPSGDLFFVDQHWQRIYRWSDRQRRLSTVRDTPIDAANLIVDKAGNVLVVSYAGNGTVYSFNPDAPGLDVTPIAPEPSAPRPGMTAVVPVDYWRFNNDLPDALAVQRPYQFVSPDRTLFMPAGEDFIRGTLYYGSKIHDVLRAFTLAKARPGDRVYVSDESELQTFSATVDVHGTLTKPELFVEQGGEGVAVDPHGNVYLAAGEIYVYSPSGQLLGSIAVPERPTGLVFGGADGRTLFITARSALFAIRTR